MVYSNGFGDVMEGFFIVEVFELELMVLLYLFLGNSYINYICFSFYIKYIFKNKIIILIFSKFLIIYVYLLYIKFLKIIIFLR